MGSGMVVSSPSDSRAEWKATPFFFFSYVNFFPLSFLLLLILFLNHSSFSTHVFIPSFKFRHAPWMRIFVSLLCFFPKTVLLACLPPRAPNIKCCKQDLHHPSETVSRALPHNCWLAEVGAWHRKNGRGGSSYKVNKSHGGHMQPSHHS